MTFTWSKVSDQSTEAAGEVPGLEGLTPSYLSIDTDSRVVRLDSWSKVLAPGLRLGWVAAHPAMIELMALALHASLNGPPGVSQVFQPLLHMCLLCPPATNVPLLLA